MPVGIELRCPRSERVFALPHRPVRAANGWARLWCPGCKGQHCVSFLTCLACLRAVRACGCGE
eukprot:401711-Alexandrium_andersonii.AAC.1